MDNQESREYESTANELIEDINHIQKTALGEGAATCHVCGDEIPEGATVTAYAFRSADTPTFEIGHLKCPSDRNEPTEHFTLGVRELVVEGRVGRCCDQATQSSWPVLLDPEPHLVSPAHTDEGHPTDANPLVMRTTPATSDLYPADAPDTIDTDRFPWDVPGPDLPSDAATHPTDGETTCPNTTDTESAAETHAEAETVANPRAAEPALTDDPDKHATSNPEQETAQTTENENGNETTADTRHRSPRTDDDRTRSDDDQETESDTETRTLKTETKPHERTTDHSRAQPASPEPDNTVTQLTLRDLQPDAPDGGAD